MKVVFECELDLDPKDGARFDVIQVSVQQNNEWRTKLMFAFSRANTVREGKHLRLDGDKCVVVKVGK